MARPTDDQVREALASGVPDPEVDALVESLIGEES